MKRMNVERLDCQKKRATNKMLGDHASVFPFKLQVQSDQHILKVFNEKIVAGLKI